MNRLWVRLTLAFVGVTLVGVLTVALLANFTASQEFRQYVARQDVLAQSGLVEDLASFYQSKGSWNDVGELLSGLPGPGAGGGGMGLMRGRPSLLLADANAQIVYDGRNARLGGTLTADERANAVPVVANGGTIGYLVVSAPERGVMQPAAQNFLDQLQNTLLIAAAVAGGLGILLGLVISRTLTAPLGKLAQAARAFAARDWNHRVQIGSAEEIAQVGLAFNEMADELQRAETLRRNLMTDIAHELRTPLTVMQGNLQAMLDEVYPLDRAEIATLYDQTRGLQRLVEDLREMALAEAGQLLLNLQPIEAAAQLRAAASTFSVTADAQGVGLSAEGGIGLLVRADPDRLAQVLRNLIANALRHTPSGGNITLAAASDGKQVQISVTDSGEGIAAEDLPHVFERFYRGDKSRARASGGTGLGLAIARAWVQAMGGEIGVESTVNHGSRFWFTLPLV